MKNIFKSMLLWGFTLSCFVGCGESPQTSEKDSSLTESTSSSSLASDSGTDGSTADPSSADNGNSYNAVNFDDLDHDSFDFTEDDLRLQSFLKENWDMAYYLCRTYKDPAYEKQYESDPEHKYRYFLKTDDYEVFYDLVDNTYFDNAEEYLALCEEYFSSDVSKVSIPDADVVDPENDYISIRGDLDYEPQLIEVNGRLYHIASGMGGVYVPRLDMAKVISKTDSEIVFSYLCVLYVPDDVTAGQGVLKKEDGVWKFGWSDLSMPIENLDIHKVWGI